MRAGPSLVRDRLGTRSKRDRAGNGPAKAAKRPLYPRLLRLRHVRPNGWQRALLAEGVLAVAAVLVLADLATAWTLLVLPLAVAVLVKAHDVLAGVLAGPGRGAGTADGAGLPREAGAGGDVGG